MQFTVKITQPYTYTVYSTLYTVYSIQYTVYTMLYTLHSIKYTVYSTQYTVHSVQDTVYVNPQVLIWADLTEECEEKPGSGLFGRFSALRGPRQAREPRKRLRFEN